MEDRSMQFEDLDAWQQAKRLVVGIYEMTSHQGLVQDFGIKNQIQRSAVSIMSNIAEGFERISLNEKRQFYSIARASCGETRSLLHLIDELFPAYREPCLQLRQQAVQTGKLISGLLRSTEQRSS